jgi:hypothetical protein
MPVPLGHRGKNRADEGRLTEKRQDEKYRHALGLRKRNRKRRIDPRAKLKLRLNCGEVFVVVNRWIRSVRRIFDDRVSPVPWRRHKPARDLHNRFSGTVIIVTSNSDSDAGIRVCIKQHALTSKSPDRKSGI